MAYALKITWRDGGTDYVRANGEPSVTRYAQKDDAEAVRRRLLDRLGTEVIALDIVPAPRWTEGSRRS